MKTIRLVKVSTTPYEEEDFFLMTNLSNPQIEDVIMPIVNEERFGRDGYDNKDLYKALKSAYPKETIIFSQEPYILSI